MTPRIFLVVPKLIEQPTWGGRYILKFKGWTGHNLFKNLKIGQSYELFSGIKLRGDINSSLDPTLTGELGYAMKPDKIFYDGDKSKLIPVGRLIKENPEGILGKKVIEKHGPKIKILIKFTQARGNSFQLHVKEKDISKKWRSKPESFYYFEPGLLTLGVKKGIDWIKFKESCVKIQQGMENLSNSAQDKKITLLRAKKRAKELIEKHNLWQYVNLVKSRKDELIHISGGLHHSWEEDERKYPLGNVLYELDFDVMDPVSTIRCFDKGKIKPSGALRKIDIDDYFKYIDRSDGANEPKNHFAKPKVILEEKGTKIESLLRTKHYSMDKISTNSDYCGEFTELNGSFHHLFVKAGKVEIRYNGKRLELTKGHSCFIPAFIGQYRIISKTKKENQLLKTFVS